MRKARMRSKFLTRPVAVVLALSGLAACGDRAEPPPPEPEPSAAPTSIIREGFEEPVADVVPLAPLDVRISFADGGAQLSESAIADLETLLDSPQMKASGPITLRAHTDSSGSDEANMRASRTRGELVRDWLVEQGVAEDRITLVAFGEQNPIEPNALPDGSANEAGRALNRRVDIHVAVEEPPEPSLAEEFDEEAQAEDEAAAEAQ